MPENERRLVRAAIVLAIACGIATVLVGVGAVSTGRKATTIVGTGFILETWIVVSIYLGLAAASVLLIQAGRPWYRGAVGSGLALAAAWSIESAFRPISAVFPGRLWLELGHLLGWVGLAAGLTIALTPRMHDPLVGRWVAPTGYVALIAAHALGAVGVSEMSETARAQLSSGLSTFLLLLTSVLVLFAAWQVAEFVRGGVDTARALWRPIRDQWLLFAISIKLLLVVLGLVLLPSSAFPDWEEMRADGPFAWAVAIAAAMAIVTWILHGTKTAITKGAISRAAVIVVLLWSLPFVMPAILLSATTLLIVVAPSSMSHAVGVAFVGVLASWMWTVMSERRSRRLATSALALGLTFILGGNVASGFTKTWGPAAFENRLVSGATNVAEGLADAAQTWQVVAFLGLLVFPLAWAARGWSGAAAAAALVPVGIWLFPTTLSVALDTPIQSPGLMSLDIAITVAVVWVFGSSFWRHRTLPATRAKLGGLVLVSSIIVYGAQIASPIATAFATGLARFLDLDAEALILALLLVVPGIWAIVMDSEEVSKGPADVVFSTVGLSLVLISVGLGLVGVGGMEDMDAESTLLRTLLVPGLLISVAVMFSEQTAREEDVRSRQRVSPPRRV